MPPSFVIRDFRAGDTPRLIEVIGGVFREYGMRFDPDGFDRDVRLVHERYAPPGAAFFAAEAEGRLVGFAGVDLPRPENAELHRLYIDPAARGLGLGALLCARVESWALERGARAIEAWSDVRFTNAHALYATRGYRVAGQRSLGDPDRSVEFGLLRPLDESTAPQKTHPAARPEHPSSRNAPEEALTAVPPDRLQDADLRHRAAMITAALLDPRSLLRAGRVSADGAHDLPDPRELFPRASQAGISAVLFRGDILAGFEIPGDRRLHPLIAREVGAS